MSAWPRIQVGLVTAPFPHLVMLAISRGVPYLRVVRLCPN